MTLLIYYIVAFAFLNTGSIALALMVERMYPAYPMLSMWIYLLLFFGSLWLAWIIAVRVTEPKQEAKSVNAAQPAE